CGRVRAVLHRAAGDCRRPAPRGRRTGHGRGDRGSGRHPPPSSGRTRSRNRASDLPGTAPGRARIRVDGLTWIGSIGPTGRTFSMPGVGSHHLVRTVAALVALAAVAAGCGNNDDSTGDEPRTPRPSTPEATTEPPTEPAALDPCALVDAAAVSDALGTQLRVTSRGARPAANGWQTTCGYGTFPGSYVVSVEVS